MRIAGERPDGARLIYLDGGMAVVLRGTETSRILDMSVADRLGPWTPTDNSPQMRRQIALLLDGGVRVNPALDHASRAVPQYTNGGDRDLWDDVLHYVEREEDEVELPRRVDLGDYEGHPFRGNQWTTGEGEQGGDEPGDKEFTTRANHSDSGDKDWDDRVNRSVATTTEFGEERSYRPHEVANGADYDASYAKDYANQVRNDETRSPKEREHAEAIGIAEAAYKKSAEQLGAKDTYTKFYDPETKEWSPEREKIHDDILDKALKGKTPGGDPDDIQTYVMVNADDVKTVMPEYNGFNAALVHEESAYVADLIEAKARALGLNILYDATLKTAGDENDGGALGKLRRFKDAGYQVHVDFIDVPVETSVNRAMDRFVGNSEHRYVPPSVIRHGADEKFGSKARGTFERLRDKVDSYRLIDNTAPGRPRLIEQKKADKRSPRIVMMGGLTAAGKTTAVKRFARD